MNVGSGIHSHTRGLKRLLDAGISGRIKWLVVLHKNRLLCFGTELVFATYRAKNVEVVLLNQDKETTFEEDWAKGVLEIIALFSAWLCGGVACARTRSYWMMSKKLWRDLSRDHRYIIALVLHSI